MHLCAMTLRVTKTFDGQRSNLRLIGRSQSASVEDIRERMKGKAD